MLIAQYSIRLTESSDLQDFHAIHMLLVVGNPALSIANLMVIGPTVKLAVFSDAVPDRCGAAGPTAAQRVCVIIFIFHGNLRVDVLVVSKH